MSVLFLKVTLALLVIAALVFFLPRLITSLAALSRLRSVQEVNSKPVAIVFGAGLWWDGSPTPVLRDRVQAAANLYFEGKVQRLLMSGTTIGTYNESRAMRNYAMSLGIPNEVIVQDYNGLRTYDTCYRALHIYGVQQAILVTQRFHLPRALYLCNALGMEVEGVSADLREYRRQSLAWWNVRETFATIVALWEIHVQPPEVILGDPEPILVEEAQ